MPLFNSATPTEAKCSAEHYTRAADFNKQVSPSVLTLTGLGTLAMLSLVTFPLADAVILLFDFNFMFWGGRLVPAAVVIALLSVLMVYVTMIGTRGSNGFPVRELANIVAGFCLLLGVTSTGLNYRHVFVSAPSLSTAVIVALLGAIVMYILVVAGRKLEGYSSRDLVNIAAPFCMLIGMTLTLLNYFFHGSPMMPTAVIMSLAGVLVVYVMVICARGVKGQGRSGHELASVAATFCMFVGLTLGLASMFLFLREAPIASAMKNACGGNVATQEASRHYSSLLKLRETPACASKFSIVECAGYATVAPPEYTKYFHSLEDKFRCSGFCHAGVQTEANTALELGSEGDSQAMCQTKVDLLASEARKLGSGGHPAAPTSSEGSADSGVATTPAAAPATTVAAATAAPTTVVAAAPVPNKDIRKASRLPPALFSQTAFKSSCDAAASRALTDSVMNTAKVWSWMAMALIATSALLLFGVEEFAGFSINFGRRGEWCTPSQ